MDTSTTTMMLMPLMAIFSQSDKSSWLSYLPLCIPLLIPLLPKSVSLPVCFTSCFRKTSVLSFTSRLRLTHWDTEFQSFVRNFSIVLWEWNRLNKTVNCKNLLEESLSHWREDTVQYTMPLFIDDATNRFWHLDRPDILYSMWVDTITDRDGHVIKDILLRIEFTDPASKPTHVVEHTEFILAEAKRLERERHRTQRVLVSTNTPSSGGEREGARDPVPLMSYEFNTTSSFDNFFAEEATLVQNDLKHFLEDKEAYRRSGRPWTYTVLNEGPPGVGKTKLVKAIAAQTGYTLLVVNLAHIQSVQMLYELFHTSTLAGELVPHDKRIYYLPELDTQLVELIKTREAPVVPVLEGAAKPSATLITAIPDTKRIGLGEILNVLDGVPERYGHIVILDTNHLKELDPALIRPGRIDRILSWKKMSSASVRRFLENYYSESVPSGAKLPDRAFSAAELQSLVAQYETLKELMRHLGPSRPKKN